MDIAEAKAIAALVTEIVQPVYTTLNAQFEARLVIGRQLTRIADALERAFPIGPEAVAAAPVACTHPLEQRIDFGMTNGVEDWQCGVPGCGFRTVPQEQGVTGG